MTATLEPQVPRSLAANPSSPPGVTETLNWVPNAS
jgi:hypothetical protein